jgi:hypothetical protein
LTIGEHGKLEAIERKSRTEKKLLAAMKEIELVIDSNGGLYPLNNGKLSQQELLRRAKLSSAALQKRTHERLRNDVNAWLRRVLKKSICGAKSVRKAVTDRVEGVKAELEQLMQQRSESELEYIEAKDALAKQELRISELEQENERLKRAISGGNVVGFPATVKKALKGSE